jgi:putative transposase
VLTEHGCAIAPNTYYCHKKRPVSARKLRDEYLKEEIRRVHAASLEVYGADKVWSELNREGIRVARCSVERLMSEQRPGDLVARNFRAAAPNRLWVADLT